MKIAFDPNVRKELVGNPAYFASVREMIDICSMFLPSEDDIAALFPGRDLNSVAADFFARGADYVVLKKGDKGCEGVSRTGEHPASRRIGSRFSIRPGPATASARPSSRWSRSGKFSFRQALERANAAGALAVTKVGPMEGNSSLAALEDFLAKGK